jgi:hypothetical protein
MVDSPDEEHSKGSLWVLPCRTRTGVCAGRELVSPLIKAGVCSAASQRSTGFCTRVRASVFLRSISRDRARVSRELRADRPAPTRLLLAPHQMIF